MDPTPPTTPQSTADTRALLTGLVGGSVSTALALALVALVAVLNRNYRTDIWLPDSVGILLYLMMLVLPLFAFAGLPLTGYLAASRARTGPGRSGLLAAATVAIPVLALFLVLSRWERDGVLAVLVDGAVYSAVAAGIVLLGAAVGTRRWNRAAAAASAGRAAPWPPTPAPATGWGPR